jgi:FKBP-type peptidyl-prolyl cis-trans isomerase FkpA
MKKILCILTLVTAIAANAQEPGYTKTASGINYKIVSAGGTKVLNYGNFIEFSFKQTYKDSVMASSEDFSNQMAMLDSVNIPADIYSVFSQCKVGDSVILKVSTDSIFKQGMPPYMQPGQHIITCYKIESVYTDKEQADSAFAVLNSIAKAKSEEKAKKQMVVEDKLISDYLAANSINAEKTPGGTYIQILVPGKGKKADSNTAVSINYTGKTFAGKVFDSNTDPAFGHTEPYEVKMWAPEVIQGWVEAIPYFSLGTKARVYIPSPMGYGVQGNGNDIRPNETLIFDMEIVKMTPKPAPAVVKPPVKKPAKPVAPKKKTVPAKKPVKKK